MNWVTTTIRALDVYKRQVYKAVVTPGNAAWSFYQLYDELRQERTAVESGSQPG